jgi:N-acetylmuramoyl-L-alanine amidase
MAKYKLKIDPGHGGKDPGAISKFGHEEDWTLKISLYQYNRFKELGINVGLTRDSDVTLTEDQRVKLAQEGEYCISNHLNAGGGDRAEVVHSIYDDGKLANAIKAQLLAVGQQAVRVYFRKGTSGDYYYMHRRTGATKTIIVEYCFIDNETDFKHFKDNWEAYAEATVKAFSSHIGHPYKIKNQTSLVQHKPKEEDEMIEKAVVIYGEADYPTGKRLAARLGIGGKPIGVHERADVVGKKFAKELYVVGGDTNGMVADKVVLLSGDDYFTTVAAVKKFLG